jgi:hypothetical protein
MAALRDAAERAQRAGEGSLSSRAAIAYEDGSFIQGL